MVPIGPRKIVSEHDDTARILVLETDEPHPETQQEKGSFGEVLNELFGNAGEEHDPQLGIETLMQFVVEPDGGRVPKADDIPEDIHAILITGSVYDAYGDDEWIQKLQNLIRHLWIHRPDIKFTGICFGHQILCRTLGSKVAPNSSGEWELSHTQITLTDIGRSLFNLPDTEKYIYLHEMHLDYVANPPGPRTSDLLDPKTQIHVWGTSDHTGVQGVYIQKRLFTTQGHMEFDEKMVKRQIEMRVKAGSVKREDADEAVERADWMHDGLIVAKAVLRFFHGDDDDLA